ncbi:ABC transporter permease [bacterium]|nr:ABC transporter permease [bacterium]
MRRLIGFFRKEIIALVRDPVLLVAVLIMPAVQLIVLSGAITLEAKNLRLAADIAPNDTIMERLYDHAIGSGWFVRAPNTDKDPAAAVQAGDADVAIVAPGGGVTAAGANGGAEIQVLIDSVNILKAQSIEAYLNGVLMGVARDMGVASAPGVQLHTRILFNPQLNTKWFMVPALLAVLIFLALLILITISIAKEKETGTIETLISAPVSKYEIILGKVVPYIVVAFLIMVSILIVGMIGFGVPFVGGPVMFVLAFLVFCVPASGAAVLLADYTHNQQQALLGIVIVAFLALMLSGALFPTENMPRLLQYISGVNPLSHYSYMVRAIMLKGPDWTYFVHHSFVMLFVGAIIWVFAIKKFKTTL